MNVIRFSIRYPVTTSVAVILVVLFGLVSLMQLPIQLTPDVSKPEITVSTPWQGASPKEVEREIVDKQEEQLKGVEGLEKMFGESAYDSGEIILRFPAGTNTDTALLRVSNRLNQVKEYPDEVDEPVISSADTRGMAMGWFIFEPLAGNPVAIDTLRDFAEDVIKARFERIPGVAASNVYGGRKRELRVLVDPLKLATRSLTVLDLARALDQENRDYSAGDFDEGKRSYVVRTTGEYQSPEDVANVIIARRDGAPVYVQDVATVSVAYQEPSHVVREMGRNSIAVNAIRETGANTLNTMEQLRTAVRELNDEILQRQGFKLFQVYDETDYIYSSIDLVQINLVIGGILAVTVLFLFLRTASTTFVVGLAIPISIMGTFIALWVLGRNVNVISLAGMTLAGGMLVDNSIVVLENIYRHRESGKPLWQAAYDGTVEVWGAVLASTLTTIAVFVPIVFIEEQAGQLFRDIAIAISAGVGLSLLVSITVIPCLSARLLTTNRETGRRRFVSHAKRPEDAAGQEDRPAGRKRNVSDRIGKFVYRMCGSTRWRMGIVFGLTAFALGIITLFLPKAEYLPSGNRNLIFGIVLPPPGYNTEKFIHVGESIEHVLTPHWEAEPGSPEEAALDGPSIRNFFYVARGRSVFMGGRTNDDADIRDLIPVFRRALADIPGIIGIVTQSSLFQRGLGGGRNIDIEITGPGLDKLLALGGQVFGQVRAILPGAQVRPKPSLDLGSPEVRVHLKRDRAADVQMTNQELGFTIDALVDGAKASDYQFEGDEIDLTIRGIDQYADRTQDLGNLPIFTPGGRLTTVGDIADIALMAGPEQINHIERERAITIQVIPPSDVPLETAMDLIQRQIVNPIAQAGTLGRLYHIHLAGTADDLTKTYDALKYNLLMALLITYLLMAALFESFLYPFVIIFSVPLAAAGGILGLSIVNRFIAQQPMDVLTMLGFIILIGVVVNNAILVVHQALNFMDPQRLNLWTSDEDRATSGMPARQAIAESVRSRVRPIMMSMLTTTFGLLPLVLASGAGSELYRGIGSVVLGGLMLSTMFTLLLVPAIFSLMMGWKLKTRSGSL
ncbi:MAG: efflux RND transporter permease subunit [Nitrospira sp. SB0677_bin_15]|nr:efflux RND transporter permease subunit [Nitrospira sp. SB0667_bin_9]MYD30813.1 efflux RND transporter permease subunit [Nitrospira sp. SB0661_bin_20]MYG40501.1 efflux RND transporter permease subunit [Nitrospira sp. SB0677_bin_15]MYJ22397.1 efflux RND transporter permease subunit [Nitrospira sp. SB0673_bin_12]